MFATAESTIQAGQVDLAVRLTGDQPPLTLVAAARIAGGAAWPDEVRTREILARDEWSAGDGVTVATGPAAAWT